MLESIHLAPFKIVISVQTKFSQIYFYYGLWCAHIIRIFISNDVIGALNANHTWVFLS